MKKRKKKFKWDGILTKEFLIEQYINLKKTTREIAKEIGCSHQTILNKLNEYDILIRTISEAQKGIKRKPFTEEARQKMSDSKKGIYPSEETRQKMREAQKGKKRTEETRQKMREAKKGEFHPNFKGRIKSSGGYIYIYSIDHPFKNCDNRVYEHRLKVEAKIGRYLDPKWVVHHINGIKDDNRIENLICFTSNSAHKRFHKDPNNVKESEIIFDGRKYQKGEEV